MIAAFRDANSVKDTFTNFHFVVDQNSATGSNTAGCFDLLGTDSVYVDTCTFLSINNDVGGGGPHAAVAAVILAGSTNGEVYRCRIDSFIAPFTYSSWNSSRVGYCTVSVTGQAVFQHRNWSGGADGNRFFGNYISGIMPPAVKVQLVEMYSTNAQDGDSLDLVFAYNTVVAYDSFACIGFMESAALGYTRPGIVMVGNILATEGADMIVDTGVIIRFREYSSNAFNDRRLEPSAAIDSTTTAPGFANKIDSTYDFVDSVGGNFRLYTTSDMLAYTGMLVSDSAWCDSFFTAPNYNIGAYQGTGEILILNNLPIGPNTTIWPVVIGTRQR